MFDALAPAVDALDAALGRRRAARRRRCVAAAAAAEAGRDATIPMLARKGRASYLGERSVGHQDPGATSSALLVRGRRSRAGLRQSQAAPMVGIVVVSHSRALAGRRWRWPRRCCTARRSAIAIAAGLDDDTFGTDAVQIVEAIERCRRGDGVVVLMDLGSAVLSRRAALDLLDDDVPGPGGALRRPARRRSGRGGGRRGGRRDAATRSRRGRRGLAGKQSHLGTGRRQPRPTPDAVEADGLGGIFTVANAHGLHARPAARLVAEVRRLDAQVPLRNLTTGVGLGARPRACRRVAALGALRRARGRGTAHRGSQAGEAARRSAGPGGAALRRGRALPPQRAGPVAGRVPRRPRRCRPRRGSAIGPAWLARRPSGRVVADAVPAGDPAAEWRRLRGGPGGGAAETSQRVRARIAREVGEAEAAIFDAHLLLLDDAELLDDVAPAMDGGQRGRGGLVGGRRRESRTELARSPDPYLSARAADVRAVGDQVLRDLLGLRLRRARRGAACSSPRTSRRPRRPSSTRRGWPRVVLGVRQPHLAQRDPGSGRAGSRRSSAPGAGGARHPRRHAGRARRRHRRGRRRPMPRRRRRVQGRGRRRRPAAATRRSQREPRTRRDPRRRRDRWSAPTSASPADAAAAGRPAPTCAGPVRTEFLFLGRTSAPDVDEQEAAYRQIAEALGGRRLTLRTLDVGGDKPLHYAAVPGRPTRSSVCAVSGCRCAQPELLA